ncbi:MAG: hypothetical protein AAFY81_07045, partial [Pseudomonadota bacterium]
AFVNGKLIGHDDVRRVVQQLASEKKLTMRGYATEAYFSLTDTGLVGLEKHRSDTDDLSISEEELNAKRWERLQSVVIDSTNSEAVNRLIDKSLDELNKQKLGNEQHSQAAAYMLAAKELVNAPVPPSKIIWDLIQKAAAIAGIVQIILPIFGALL